MNFYGVFNDPLGKSIDDGEQGTKNEDLYSERRLICKNYLIYKH